MLIFCFMQHKDVNVLWYGHYCNSLECCKAMSGENIVTPFNKLGICLYMWKMIIYTTQKIRGTHHLSKICCTRIVCPTRMWTDGDVLCPTTSSPYAFANLSCEIYHIWLIFVWNTKFQCQWMNYTVATVSLDSQISFPSVCQVSPPCRFSVLPSHIFSPFLSTGTFLLIICNVCLLCTLIFSNASPM